MKGVGHEAVGLLMDAGRSLAIGRINEAEDLARFLVYPVMLVIHPVLGLDANVRLVGPDDVAGCHAGDVVDVQISRHCESPVPRFDRCRLYGQTAFDGFASIGGAIGSRRCSPG